MAGEIETLEGEELPTLVEKLGDIVNPEEESAAAAALSVGAHTLQALLMAQTVKKCRFGNVCCEVLFYDLMM